MEEKKVMETENMAANNEEQKAPGEEIKNEEKKESIFSKIGTGIKNNKKKIGVAVAVVGAFGAGAVCDHFGIKLPKFGKKTDQAEDAAPAEE